MITINEIERYRILEMYNVNNIRPLARLLSCEYSSDGRYVVFERKVYSTDSGDEILLTEAWTISDILHASADVLSAGADFVIPGSGAIIDTLNAISYIIEAQFVSPEKKDSLYLMAAITFAFVALPGPLQAVAIPLKRVLKGGVKVMSAPVKTALGVVGGILPKVLDTIPNFMNKALGSKFGKNIMGKWGTKIAGFFADFSKRSKTLFSSITGKAAKEGTEVAGEEIVKIGERGKIWLNTFSKGGWHMPTYVKGNMSGWKFHVFAENINDSAFIVDKLSHITEKWGAGLKVAGEDMYKRLSKNTNQLGKGATIYIPSNVVKEGKQVEFLNEIQQALKGYKKSGAISGDKMINGTIGLRFEGNIAIDASKGVNPKLLSGDGGLYNKNIGGSYNPIKGNKDLFDYPAIATAKIVTKAAAKTSLTTATRTSLLNFFKRTPNISKASTVLRKAGFVPGKTYRYMGPKGMTTGTIKSITDTQVLIVFKNGTSTTFSATTFIKNAIGAPWTRRGSGVLVPLFVKRFSDMLLPDGSNINYNRLEQFQDLDPDATSQESLEYMQEEVSSYQGNTRQYSVQTNVTTFQNGLQSLGYTLPRFGVDGKFGPETQAQLQQFQQKNGLEGSIGKMDRLTARKISELLKTSNVVNSEELQNQLNSI